MKFTGGCYCGKVRYEAEGEPVLRGLCHCRECQYISGGAANVALGMPLSGFHYTKGEPKIFERADLEQPVKRQFCPDCGTSLASLPPRLLTLSYLRWVHWMTLQVMGHPILPCTALRNRIFTTCPKTCHSLIVFLAERGTPT